MVAHYKVDDIGGNHIRLNYRKSEMTFVIIVEIY